MSITLFEILEEQLAEAQRQDNYVPSKEFKRMVCVSTAPKVVRKKHAKRVKKLSKKKSKLKKVSRKGRRVK